MSCYCCPCPAGCAEPASRREPSQLCSPGAACYPARITTQHALRRDRLADVLKVPKVALHVLVTAAGPFPMKSLGSPWGLTSSPGFPGRWVKTPMVGTQPESRASFCT